MNRRTLLAAPLVAAMATGLTSPVLAAEPSFYFVDILSLQEGKTPADAAVYFEKIEPIVAEHGLARAMPSLNIANVMRGEVPENMLNVWTVTDPEGTFKGIFDDARYLEHVPLRDSIFDLANSKMMVLVPNE